MYDRKKYEGNPLRARLKTFTDEVKPYSVRLTDDDISSSVGRRPFLVDRKSTERNSFWQRLSEWTPRGSDIIKFRGRTAIRHHVGFGIHLH